MKNGMVTITSLAAVVLAFSAALSICRAGELEGEWDTGETNFNGRSGSLHAVFGPDAIATFRLRMQHTRTEESFQYRLENGELYLYPIGEAFDIEEVAEIEHSFVVGKLRLVLHEDMGPILLERVDKSTATVSPAPSKPAPRPEPPTTLREPAPRSPGGVLEGVWESGDLPGGRRLVFDFQPSGTVRITAIRDGRSFVNEGAYTEGDAEVRIRSDAGREMVVPKKWAADRLSLTVEGEEIVFFRQGAATGDDSGDDDNPWF